MSEDDCDLQDMLDADVHVHHGVPSPECVSFAVASGGASIWSELTREEIDFLIAGVATSLEAFMLTIGDTVVHVMHWPGEPDERSASMGVTKDHVMIGISYAGSDVMWACQPRDRLVRLLRDGCGQVDSKPTVTSHECN